MALHYSQGEFGTREGLARALERERMKDVSLDDLDGFAAQRGAGGQPIEQALPDIRKDRAGLSQRP